MKEGENALPDKPLPQGHDRAMMKETEGWSNFPLSTRTENNEIVNMTVHYIIEKR